jgi:hypothetical protein
MIRMGPETHAAMFGPGADHNATVEVPPPVEPSATAQALATKYGLTVKLSTVADEVAHRVKLFRASKRSQEAFDWEHTNLPFQATSLVNFAGLAVMPSALGTKEPVFTVLIENKLFNDKLRREAADLHADGMHDAGSAGQVERKAVAMNVFKDEDTPGFTVFANAQTAFPAAGSKDSASGSLFHALFVPNVRIYNAVTFTKPRVTLVRKMMDFYTRPVYRGDSKAYEEAREAYKQRIVTLVDACRSSQINKMTGLKLDEAHKNHWSAVYDTMWSKFIAKEDWDLTIELGMFFHLHNEAEGKGDMTVGHLHMHVFPINKELRTNYEHDTKCFPAETVCQFFEHE